VAISTSEIFNTEGIQLPKDAFVVIVKTAWNAAQVDELTKAAVQTLKSKSVDYEVIEVPGAFEIPFAIQNCWNKGKKPHAFIALGCVIRGGTPHFEYVCRAVTDGISQLNLMLPVPTIFGILTVDNIRQANERIGGEHGHKGTEAAVTALKMIEISLQ
jgi:6,7-dimethyl-8-ribityllumazine synthase